MTRASTVAFRPRNPLARILSGVDAKSFADHVAGAEQAVQAIVPLLIDSLDGDVRALARLCHQDEAVIFGECREIGWLALSIVESARLAGRPHLASAAQGVWEMVEALSERGVWHTEALKVHADALGTLALGAVEGPAASMIVRELAGLRQAIGVAATS